MSNYDERKIEERYHSLTVPSDMYYLQQEIAVGAVNKMEAFLKQDIVKEQAKELGRSAFNLENASSEAVKQPLSTPKIEEIEEQGKARG
ncbi:MAG: hypothetical protein PG981_000795 [Wolbachia endosymbiont of Ctenocephalides orientis wCori]|nr:MAG: hypothetical protein PG981_000795 [Wolbachia endosymbiont of Ctenocephalides orientis wCori]